ncbi:esterase [Bombiscardovia coagulans]|uniref:Esterase n=2 Tax=Bombiscardovia coagulans TaxID=686666 RepID=A0A261EW64_9BIFI|nr:esterase [Bombiscardovia coagulans]
MRYKSMQNNKKALSCGDMNQDNVKDIVAAGIVGDAQRVTEVRYSRKEGKANQARPMFVLLHGWGSREDDIADLMRYVAPYNDYVALRAPMQVPGSEQGMFGPGFTWFHRALPQGRELDADGFSAATAINEWVATHIPAEREVVVMGFSQGAMLAAHLLRINPERYRASICLSGFLAPGLVEGTAPADDRLVSMQKPVFLGFGKDDRVVPPYESRAFAAWLDEHVWLYSRAYDHLGHSVSMTELADVHQWLADIDVTSGLM